MKHKKEYIVTLFIGCVSFIAINTSAHEYDFGLMESEPLLQKLFIENTIFLNKLSIISTKYSDRDLEHFVKTEFNSNVTQIPADVFVQHPINVFHLIKRYGLFIKQLFNQMKSKEIVEKIKTIYEETEILKTVNQEDFTKCVNAIVVMIHSYELDMNKLRDGIIDIQHLQRETKPFKSVNKLSTSELLVIAQHAEGRGLLGTAANIIKPALTLVNEEPMHAELRKVLRKSIAQFKREILIKHNGYLEKTQSVATDKYVFNTYLLNENLEKRKKQPKYVKAKDMIDVNKIKDSIKDDGASKFKTDSMLKTCGGKTRKNMAYLRNSNLPNVSENRTHKCRHLHHKDPYSKLGPFKLEILHHEPFIMIFHEMFTEEDTDYLVDWARPRLSRKREKVEDKDQKKTKNEHLTRTTTRQVHKSVQAWMSSRIFNPLTYSPENSIVKYPRAEKISERLEKAVNMNVTNQYSSEQYQITSYGLGGLCEDHNDPYGYNEGVKLNEANKELANTGDIFGTVMGWLSDTPAGGATSFFLGDDQITIWPTKGAAGFWFGLSSDGKRDSSVVHGGCPVLVGSKWIMNKWVKSFNQWDRYPCNREQFVRIKPWEDERYL